MTGPQPEPAPDRIVVGGTDVTDDITRLVADAPPFTPAQLTLLRNVLGPALQDTA